MRLYSIEDRNASFVATFVQSAANHGFEARIILPNSDVSPAFAKFKQVYRHFSINSERFELACFRRYFEVARLMSENERFIIADSDLLINSAATMIPRMFADQPDVLIGSIGYKSSNPEQDISPHFSFWNPALVHQFIEYLIHIYESHIDRLVNIYNTRKEAGNKRAAISDMTLLHMFVHEMSVPFINSNRVVDGMLIDHNFSMAESADSIFMKEYGFKLFRRDQGDLMFITTDGQEVRPLVIHLQGRAKIAAKSLADGHDIAARARLGSLSLARLARQWLS